MRVVLFGGSGQLGTALHAKLSGGFEVTAPGRTACDLAKSDQVIAYLKQARPDVIINAAAYTQVDHAETNQDVAWAVNARANESMAEFAAQTNTFLITYSTDYVFDGTATKPYTESDLPHPTSEYGRSKLAGEQAIRNSGCAHLIIRTGWLYSTHGANFLKTILRLAQERTELSVVDDQVGCPTSAEWLADTTVRLLAKAVADHARQTLHAVCAGQTSWHGFAAAIVATAKDLGFSIVCKDVIAIATSEYPTAATRPTFSVLDATRLEVDWGIVPPPWKEALIAVMDTLRQQQGTS